MSDVRRWYEASIVTRKPSIAALVTEEQAIAEWDLKKAEELKRHVELTMGPRRPAQPLDGLPHSKCSCDACAKWRAANWARLTQ